MNYTLYIDQTNIDAREEFVKVLKIDLHFSPKMSNKNGIFEVVIIKKALTIFMKFGSELRTQSTLQLGFNRIYLNIVQQFEFHIPIYRLSLICCFITFSYRLQVLYNRESILSKKRNYRFRGPLSSKRVFLRNIYGCLMDAALKRNLLEREKIHEIYVLFSHSNI